MWGWGSGDAGSSGQASGAVQKRSARGSRATVPTDAQRRKARTAALEQSKAASEPAQAAKASAEDPPREKKGRQSTSKTSGPSSAAEDAESLQRKLDLLVIEYQKLRQKNSVLKKAVVEEKKRTEELESDLNHAREGAKAQVSEMDAMSFHVQRLTKRVDKLKEQLSATQEEAKARQQSTSWVGSLFVGSGGTPETAKAVGHLKVTRDELQMQIKENERVHLQMFDMQKEHASTLETVKLKLVEVKTELEEQQRECRQTAAEKQALEEELRRVREESQRKIEELVSEISTSRRELKEKEQTMISSTSQLTSSLKLVTQRYAQKVAFDDTVKEEVNAWSLPAFSRPVVLSKAKVVQDAAALMDKLRHHGVELARHLLQHSQHVMSKESVDAELDGGAGAVSAPGQELLLTFVTLPTELDNAFAAVQTELALHSEGLAKAANHSWDEDKDKDKDPADFQATSSTLSLQMPDNDIDDDDSPMDAKHGESRTEHNSGALWGATGRLIECWSRFIAVNLDLLELRQQRSRSKSEQVVLDHLILAFRDAAQVAHEGLVALSSVSQHPLHSSTAHTVYFNWTLERLLTMGETFFMTPAKQSFSALSSRFASLATMRTGSQKQLEEAIVKEFTSVTNVIGRLGDLLFQYRSGVLSSLSQSHGSQVPLFHFMEAKNAVVDDSDLETHDHISLTTRSSVVDMAQLSHMHQQSRSYLRRLNTSAPTFPPSEPSVTYKEALQMQESLNAKQAALDDLQNQVKELKRLRADLESSHTNKLSEKDARIQSLSTSVASLSLETRELASDIAELKTALEEREDALKRASSQIRSLKNKLKAGAAASDSQASQAPDPTQLDTASDETSEQPEVSLDANSHDLASGGDNSEDQNDTDDVSDGDISALETVGSAWKERIERREREREERKRSIVCTSETPVAVDLVKFESEHSENAVIDGTVAQDPVDGMHTPRSLALNGKGIMLKPKQHNDSRGGDKYIRRLLQAQREFYSVGSGQLPQPEMRIEECKPMAAVLQLHVQLHSLVGPSMTTVSDSTSECVSAPTAQRLLKLVEGPACAVPRASHFSQSRDVPVCDAQFRLQLDLLQRSELLRRLQLLHSQLQLSEKRSAQYHLKARRLQRSLKAFASSHMMLKQRSLVAQSERDKLREDMRSTKENYERALHDLTEHVCNLTEKLAQADAARGVIPVRRKPKS